MIQLHSTHKRTTTHAAYHSTRAWQMAQLGSMMEYNLQSCAHGFVRRNKDPAKMTHTKMAPVKRGLGAKRAHAKSQSAQ